MNFYADRQAPQLLGTSPVYTSWQPDSLGLCPVVLVSSVCLLKTIIKLFGSIFLPHFHSHLPPDPAPKKLNRPPWPQQKRWGITPVGGIWILWWGAGYGSRTTSLPLHGLQQPHHHGNREGTSLGGKPGAITSRRDSTWEHWDRAHLTQILCCR